jgi:hypothetical protein
MAATRFVDTGVLLYSIGRHFAAAVKRSRAIALLGREHPSRLVDSLESPRLLALHRSTRDEGEIAP